MRDIIQNSVVRKPVSAAFGLISLLICILLFVSIVFVWSAQPAYAQECKKPSSDASLSDIQDWQDCTENQKQDEKAPKEEAPKENQSEGEPKAEPKPISAEPNEEGICEAPDPSGSSLEDAQNYQDCLDNGGDKNPDAEKFQEEQKPFSEKEKERKEETPITAEPDEDGICQAPPIDSGNLDEADKYQECLDNGGKPDPDLDEWKKDLQEQADPPGGGDADAPAGPGDKGVPGGPSYADGVIGDDGAGLFRKYPTGSYFLTYVDTTVQSDSGGGWSWIKDKFDSFSDALSESPDEIIRQLADAMSYSGINMVADAIFQLHVVLAYVSVWLLDFSLSVSLIESTQAAIEGVMSALGEQLLGTEGNPSIYVQWIWLGAALFGAGVMFFRQRVAAGAGEILKSCFIGVLAIWLAANPGMFLDTYTNFTKAISDEIFDTASVVVPAGSASGDQGGQGGGAGAEDFATTPATAPASLGAEEGDGAAEDPGASRQRFLDAVWTTYVLDPWAGLQISPKANEASQHRDALLDIETRDERASELLKISKESDTIQATTDRSKAVQHLGGAFLVLMMGLLFMGLSIWASLVLIVAHCIVFIMLMGLPLLLLVAIWPGSNLGLSIARWILVVNIQVVALTLLITLFVVFSATIMELSRGEGATLSMAGALAATAGAGFGAIWLARHGGGFLLSPGAVATKGSSGSRNQDAGPRREGDTPEQKAPRGRDPYQDRNFGGFTDTASASGMSTGTPTGTPGSASDAPVDTRPGRPGILGSRRQGAPEQGSDGLRSPHRGSERGAGSGSGKSGGRRTSRRHKPNLRRSLFKAIDAATDGNPAGATSAIGAYAGAKSADGLRKGFAAAGGAAGGVAGGIAGGVAGLRGAGGKFTEGRRGRLQDLESRRRSAVRNDNHDERDSALLASQSYESLKAKKEQAPETLTPDEQVKLSEAERLAANGEAPYEPFKAEAKEQRSKDRQAGMSIKDSLAGGRREDEGAEEYDERRMGAFRDANAARQKLDYGEQGYAKKQQKYAEGRQLKDDSKTLAAARLDQLREKKQSDPGSLSKAEQVKLRKADALEEDGRRPGYQALMPEAREEREAAKRQGRSLQETLSGPQKDGETPEDYQKRQEGDAGRAKEVRQTADAAAPEATEATTGPRQKVDKAEAKVLASKKLTEAQEVRQSSPEKLTGEDRRKLDQADKLAASEEAPAYTVFYDDAVEQRIKEKKEGKSLADSLAGSPGEKESPVDYAERRQSASRLANLSRRRFDNFDAPGQGQGQGPGQS